MKSINTYLSCKKPTLSNADLFRLKEKQVVDWISQNVYGSYTPFTICGGRTYSINKDGGYIFLNVVDESTMLRNDVIMSIFLETKILNVFEWIFWKEFVNSIEVDESI